MDGSGQFTKIGLRTESSSLHFTGPMFGLVGLGGQRGNHKDITELGPLEPKDWSLGLGLFLTVSLSLGCAGNQNILVLRKRFF